MNTLKNKKSIAIFAILALTTLANAAASYISGYLAPGNSTTWYGTFSRGWLTVDIDGSGYGDIDVYVYDEDGDLLGQDTSSYDGGLVDVYLPYAEHVDIVVVNHGRYSTAYDGTVN